MMSEARRYSQGFTLIEVMVALLVVAMAVSALLSQIMKTVDSTVLLRDKAIANWVALNQLEMLYIANANPASSAYNVLLDREISGKEEMAGREWFWRVKPQSIAEGSVQLTVTVSKALDDEDHVVKVIGVIDSFHEQN